MTSYDIFIDPEEAPTDRNSINEVMIWVGYKSPNSPLSTNYGSDGLPTPYETDVSLAGKSWDVYVYEYVSNFGAPSPPSRLRYFIDYGHLLTDCQIRWSTGGHTISYLDRANSGSFSGQLTDFFNHGISNGWYTSSQYLNSVMAGWEFGKGSYTATSWGATGF